MTAVITGVGVVSGFGRGLDTLHDGLVAGRVAVRPIESFDAAGFGTRVAAEVPGAWSDHRDRKVSFALAAARDAWSAAGCEPADAAGAATSIALGLERAHLEDLAAVFRDGRIDWEAERRQPGAERLRTPLDVASARVRQDLGLGGREAVHVSACAAGALSIAHAAQWVSRGQASLVLCGAADSMINPLGVGGMTRLGAPSPRASADACRPFDRARDGLVIGEGAAMFVLESEARASERGAPILARITGWGSSQDAFKATAPRPDGSAAALAMSRALSRAALRPADVSWINAHGTGTPLGDPAEARAIARVFARPVAVSSIKGAIGHCMAAAGALEIAASVAAIGARRVPPTANLGDPDPDCALPSLDLVCEARAMPVDVVLSSSFGFGGQNAAVVLQGPVS